MEDWLGFALPGHGETRIWESETLVQQRGIPRLVGQSSLAQDHTAAVFGALWGSGRLSHDRYVAWHRTWFLALYGEIAEASWWAGYGERPRVLEAGCGIGLTGFALLGQRLAQVRYLGVDISTSVDEAVRCFRERDLPGCFLQADFTRLPTVANRVSVIFSQGALHHTDDTERALKGLVPWLHPGGRILFYIYRTPGPIRALTDGYLRERLRNLPIHEAWQQLMPLTRLGQCLGEMAIQIDIPEPIDLLGIPAGPIDLHRLIYWHFLRAAYQPGLTLEELNHLNLDWFAPGNAHCHTEATLRQWCQDAGLVVERLVSQPSGIAVVARREGPHANTLNV